MIPNKNLLPTCQLIVVLIVLAISAQAFAGRGAEIGIDATDPANLVLA